MREKYQSMLSCLNNLFTPCIWGLGHHKFSSPLEKMQVSWLLHWTCINSFFLSLCVCVCVCMCMCMHILSHVQLFVTPWIVVSQVPLSMQCSRQEYWSGFPFPPPAGLPDPGIETHLLHLLHWQMDSLPLCHLGSPFISSLMVSKF